MWGLKRAPCGRKWGGTNGRRPGPDPGKSPDPAALTAGSAGSVEAGDGGSRAAESAGDQRMPCRMPRSRMGREAHGAHGGCGDRSSWLFLRGPGSTFIRNLWASPSSNLQLCSILQAMGPQNVTAAQRFLVLPPQLQCPHPRPQPHELLGDAWEATESL